MARSQTNLGELFILSQALIWSLFPVFTKASVLGLPPLTAGGLSLLASSVFFAFMLSVRRRWKDAANRTAWRDIVIATFYIGICAYGLLFIALRYTTAGNASIMGLMEVFTSFLILSVWRKHEPWDTPHFMGAVFMVIGALIILIPGASHVQKGDLIVLLACCFGPVGNRAMQRARALVSAECIYFYRSLISGVVMLILAPLFNPLPSLQAIQGSLWLILLSGVTTLGIAKIMWLEGLHRLPVTKAVSLGSISPAFTLLFAYLFLHEQVTIFQILGLLPIIVGVVLLTRSKRPEALAEEILN